MAYKIGASCGSCSANDETDGDCTCVNCTAGGQKCLPNNPDGKSAYNRFDGSFEGTSTFKRNRNISQYILGLVTLGVAVYVIGYAFKKRNKSKIINKN